MSLAFIVTNSTGVYFFRLQIVETYQPEAAPIRTCFVADCLLTSAKILSKKLSLLGAGIFPIDRFRSCFSFFVITIPAVT